MRRTIFANDEFYHLYNRGVEKRKIFLDTQDYLRGVHGLYLFNDETAHVRLTQKGMQNPILRDLVKKERNPLVEIITFCFIPNHYHLLVRQLQDGGVSRFIQKFATGYTMYFNERYKRNGVLFQGKFKSKLIDDERYFLTLLNYIHLNPVDFVEPQWREKGIKNWEKVRRFLKEYRWSGYRDYIGIENFPFLLQKESTSSYKGYMLDWMAQDLEKLGNLVLE